MKYMRTLLDEIEKKLNTIKIEANAEDNMNT